MIYPMKASDWNRVCDIYAQGIEHGISTFNTTIPSYEEWNAKHHKDCRLVAKIDDFLVGWAAISPTSSMPAYQGVVELSLYVDEHFKRKGIGCTLLKALITESEKAGYWCLYSVICSVNTASLALHEHCGFRTIGYREKIAKDKFGKWQNTTIMELRSKKIYD